MLLPNGEGVDRRHQVTQARDGVPTTPSVGEANDGGVVGCEGHCGPVAFIVQDLHGDELPFRKRSRLALFSQPTEAAAGESQDEEKEQTALHGGEQSRRDKEEV